MIEILSNEIHELAECPVWNKDDKLLYWTNIYKGNIWSYDPDKKQVKIAWEGKYIVGGFAFTENNDLILCTEKGVFRINAVGTRANLSSP